MIFEARDIQHFFEAVVSFDDYQNPKPHPEPLLVALARLQVSPDEAIYIGDGESDMAAAKAAGMRSVFLSSSDHEDAAAKINEFHQLLKAVESLSSSPTNRLS